MNGPVITGDFEKKFRERFVASQEWDGPQPSRLIGGSAIYLLQLLLRRSYALDHAARSAIATKNLNALALMIRALIETVASVGALEWKLEQLYAEKCTYDQAFGFLKQLTVGSLHLKPEDVGGIEVPPPLKVMTAIKKADLQLHARGIEEGPLRRIYNLLSEYAHPNFYGVEMYGAVSGNRTTFKQHEESFDELSPPVSSALPVALLALFRLYDDTLKLLKTKETLPRVHR